MSYFSKSEQTRKNKKINLKKMSKIEYRLYVDFIKDKSSGMCQIPNCGNQGQDIAHKDRAYKRDDRFIGLLCRNCHTIADNPSPKQIDESSRVNLALNHVSKQNWKDYNQ